MQTFKRINLCRVAYGPFCPPLTGGSIVHIIELSNKINLHLNNQILLLPKAEIDTVDFDKNFPFEIVRVNYFKFEWLQYIKKKWLNWFPVAPIMVLSYGFCALFKIVRLDRKYHFDIIQAHDVTTGIATKIAGKLLRKRSVLMTHGADDAYSKASGKYESIIARIFKPDYSLILDDGSPAIEKFGKIIGKDKMTVVYHAIDTQAFSPEERNIDLSSNIGINASFVIMGIHSLIPVKGVDYAIKAFAEFLKRDNVNNAKLIIIGDGFLQRELKQLAITLKISERVIFLGSITNSEIPNYLSLADIVGATSTYSNMNRSVQEAMAMAKPVVAFDSGGTSHTIIDGVNGVLVKSGDINGFADKLLLLYTDSALRQNLGKNARRFIVENRSWEKRIETELGVYQKLLNTK